MGKSDSVIKLEKWDFGWKFNRRSDFSGKVISVHRKFHYVMQNVVWTVMFSYLS